MTKPAKPRVHAVPIESPSARAVGSCPMPASSRPRTRDIGMPREPAALEIPVAEAAFLVNTAGWKILPPTARSCTVPTASARSELTPSKSGITGSMAESAADDTFFLLRPVILDRTSTISRFPYMRKGLDPRQIAEEEIASHLNEVRAAGSILPDNADLLAVFRKIPAELISRVRFDQGRRLLIFRLISCEGRRLTRVYDMAAVKDRLNGRIHLVPHRTRNRTVVLS